MADALKGRGIFDLMSSKTTITPESILSGKIVILDLPLKECGQGGLMVQAAWKYLFQRAIERRADKGLKTARPAFLWEDESHLFFSPHDIDFQPTARDCRAAHVMISQSLHNFYQLGHNPHAVQGVLATMNSQIFHANGDLDTNKWARIQNWHRTQNTRQRFTFIPTQASTTRSTLVFTSLCPGRTTIEFLNQYFPAT
jgi:hypothetical protein